MVGEEIVIREDWRSQLTIKLRRLDNPSGPVSLRGVDAADTKSLVVVSFDLSREEAEKLGMALLEHLFYQSGGTLT